MRELTVYYCSKCGRYGFYQVSKNAICPVCKTPMTVFPMSYQNFMDMDYNMRDQLISDQIAGQRNPTDFGCTAAYRTEQNIQQPLCHSKAEGQERRTGI